MAGMIKSIFGLTTAQQQDEYLKQQRALAAQLTKQGTNAAVAQFGTGLGASLGRGLLGKLGIEDPAMVKAEAVDAQQEALNAQLATLDADDPKRLLIVSDALGGAGDTEGQMRLLGQYMQLEKMRTDSDQSQQRIDQGQVGIDQSQQRIDEQKQQNAIANQRADEKMAVQQDQFSQTQDMAQNKFDQAILQDQRNYNLNERKQNELGGYRETQTQLAKDKLAAENAAEPFIPEPATAAALRQTSSLIKNHPNIDLNKSDRDAYGNSLHERVSKKKHEFEQNVKNKLIPASQEFNLEAQLKLLMDEDLRTGKVTLDGWFGGSTLR